MSDNFFKNSSIRYGKFRLSKRGSMDSITKENFSPIVSEAFQERKKNFSRSLKKILLHISKDQLIQKLVLDEASSYFVSDRIEEIANSIFTDDREKYIISLLEIIQKLLKNQKNVNYSLNYDIQSKLANSILASKQKSELSQIESDMLEKMGGLLINQGSNEIKPFDPSQPDTYHIYAAVDITSYSIQMKFIQTDLKTIKETTTMLFEKAKSYINQIKTKTVKAVENFYQHKKQLEIENCQLNEKLKEINDSFESTTLPMLNQQVSDIKKKYHDKNSQKKQIIIQLQNELEEFQTQNTNLAEENEKLKKIVQTMKTQISENQKVIQELQSQTQSNQQDLINKNNLIENLQNELNNLKNTNIEITNSQNILKQNFEKLSSEFTLSEEHNKYMTIELNQLKEQLPIEKEANFAAIAEITNLKSENQSLKQELDTKSIIIATFSKQNNDLSNKLSSIDHSFATFKETADSNQIIAKKNQNKIEKQNQKIIEFKKLLIEANSKIEKYKNIIKSQKDEIQNMVSKMSNYENQLTLQANDMKIDRDTIVGLQSAIYRLKSKIEILKKEKGNFPKQIISNENKLSQSITTTRKVITTNENLNDNIIQVQTIKTESNEHDSLAKTNEELRLQINQLLKRISELENLSKENHNSVDLTRKIEKLQNLNEQQSLIINTIQNISPDLDLNTYPQIIARLIKTKEFSNIVLKTLSENDFDSALLKLTELKTDSVIMNRVRSVFNDLSDNEIVESLKKYKPFNMQSNSIISKKSNSSSKVIRFSSDVENISSILGPSISPIGKK